MAQYTVHHPEHLNECPYDNTHMIMTKKMPYHLMKCRDNYKGSDYIKCPFNARHEFPRPELRYHTMMCSDKALIEKDLIYSGTKNRGEGSYFRGVTEIPELHSQWAPPSAECWDNEVSPFPVQVVDKAVFTGNQGNRSEQVDFQNFTPSEKMAFMEKIRGRVPLAPRMLTDRDDDVLRLPHCHPMVLKGTTFGPQPPKDCKPQSRVQDFL